MVSIFHELRRTVVYQWSLRVLNYTGTLIPSVFKKKTDKSPPLDNKASKVNFFVKLYILLSISVISAPKPLNERRMNITKWSK